MANWTKYVNYGLMGLFPTVTAVSDIAQGKGVVKSVAKGAVSFGVDDVVSGLVGSKMMLAKFVFDIGRAGANAYIDHSKEKGNKVGRTGPNGANIGRGFVDNENSYTMRQRSLQAMGGHQAMARNALGSEARRRATGIRY